jgi:hypothetical protein
VWLTDISRKEGAKVEVEEVAVGLQEVEFRLSPRKHDQAVTGAMVKAAQTQKADVNTQIMK